jgi:aryl-alcohol dehydrogenase-like predicted oxidoreductase
VPNTTNFQLKKSSSLAINRHNLFQIKHFTLPPLKNGETALLVSISVSLPPSRGFMMVSHCASYIGEEAFMSEDQPVAVRKQGRREFLKAGGAITAALLAPSAALADAAKTLPSLPSNPKTPTAMPTRNLGKTGYRVGIFSLGGQAALERGNNFDVAVPIIERALDLGVNYIDTSSIYGGPDRWSEQYVGKVMARRRNEAFLATKTKERTREGSMRMIEKSLQLLQTDHVDLWQLHDIGTMTDVNEIFAKGGAMEALLEMQQQKVVRNLGITGHYRPESLMECIKRHPFDTILMAINAADPHHYSFNQELLPLAVERQMGIIGMKVPARSRLLSSWTPPSIEAQKHSWEGMNVQTSTPGTMTMREAMYYVLSRPVSTVIIGCDTIAQLEENVQLAREFTPLSDTQVAGLVARAEPVAKPSLFFRFYDRP